MLRKRRADVAALLTVKQAALLLGVAEVTLRRWDVSGKFPARRHPINGYRLYREADVRELKRRIDGLETREKR